MKSAQEALGASSKYIDGRLTVCNLACEGLSSGTITSDQAQRKLYIGGLSPETTTEILLSFFSRHGEIVEGSVAYDKDTNRSRGFGFVTYKTLEATKKALDNPERILGGRNITVKYADTKSRTTPIQQPQAPPSLGNPYPQPGPAQGQPGPLNSHYTYPPSVPSYPSATSYVNPLVASTPAPYAPPPQYTYLPSSVPPTQDPVGILLNGPMSMPSYPFHMPQQ